MRQLVIATALVLLGTTAARADMPAELDGFAIHPTGHGYATLVERLDEAIEASPFNKLSAASATVGAKSLGHDIPGNMVVHAFAPGFAIRMLEASIAAGYEAPLRFYVTESSDGTATLSFKPASLVFAPYEDGGEPLRTLAAELEAIQTAIAEQAAGE